MAEVIHRISPPIPLNTDKGPGFAHFLISYGAENDLYWLVFLDKSGQVWEVPNRKVRAVTNWSFDRPEVELPKPRKKKVAA